MKALLARPALRAAAPAASLRQPQRAAAPAAVCRRPDEACRRRRRASAVVARAAAAATATTAVQQQQQPALASVNECLATFSAPLVVEPGLEGPWPAFGDHYELEGEVLGQGSYGTVRTCVDRATGEQLAVKVLPKHRAGDADGHDRRAVVAREVAMWRAAAEQGSPHVARLVGACEDETNFYLVEELLVGGDLQALLDAHGPLSPKEARSAARAVLAALVSCHAAGVVYSDVKPANFLLARVWPSVLHLLDPSAPRGELALRMVDFGCAQACARSGGCGLAEGLSGTLAYMAPEVVAERRFGTSADVWAAGVLVYHCLTGRFPLWPDRDVAGLARIHPRRVMEAVAAGCVSPLSAELPAGARDLLAAMLDRDPARRPTAQQALRHPWLAADDGDDGDA